MEIDQIYEEIAGKHGTTKEEVREQIQLVVNKIWENPKNQGIVEEYFRDVSYTGNAPTAEDFIDYMAFQIVLEGRALNMYPDRPFDEKAFAFQLKSLRESSGYTQEDVAVYIHVDRSTYCYYELGKTRPRLDTLVKLAHLYQVSIDYLLGVCDER